MGHTRKKSKRIPPHFKKSAAESAILPNLSSPALWLGALLAAVIVIVTYWPVLASQALYLDDHLYLSESALIQNPSLAAIRQIFTEVIEPTGIIRGYYHPLSNLSLMLDSALGGSQGNLEPYHRTNLALHVGNTLLVIGLLTQLFGKPWAAVGVGLLYGIHPITVEPIAWATQRKTLLAALFALGALIAYVQYSCRKGWKLQAASLTLYVLALLCKPTSLPVPALMLALDYWPLNRLDRQALKEKIPFFIVGGLAAIISFLSENTADIVLPGEQYPPLMILLIVCHNIVFYSTKVFWPMNLSAYYPYPDPLTLSHPTILAGVIGTVLLILALLFSARWTKVLLAGGLFFFRGDLPRVGNY